LLERFGFQASVDGIESISTLKTYLSRSPSFVPPSPVRPFVCSIADTQKATLICEIRCSQRVADKHCSIFFGKASGKRRNVCLAFRSGHFNSNQLVQVLVKIQGLLQRRAGSVLAKQVAAQQSVNLTCEYGVFCH